MTWTTTFLDQKRKHPMSNLLDHAKRELDLIGMGDDATDLNRAMRLHILLMVKTFAAEGHSGFSASYAINALKHLLAFEPLTPLTGNDDEWLDRSQDSAMPIWQNRRCGRVFKTEDRCYDAEGKIFRTPGGLGYTKAESCVPVVFPYRPITVYVDTPDESDESDEQL
jgi:hypothetical protein